MATTTRTRMGRTGTTTGHGRFARPSTTSARPRTANIALRRRRRPEPSGLKKAMGALVPMAAAKKATPDSKKGKAGGVALAAAAAGMAFKNREKLAGMVRKRQSSQSSAKPPATPTV